jgi:ribA/ribD-fused uncharacterized protein
METIWFYAAGDAYGCFSNFSPHVVSIDGKRWPTSEHYFQAQKFVGTRYEELVRSARGPGEAAKLGRRRAWPLRRDWESVKERIMFDALRAKFSQHADIREVLLGTGDSLLVEHTERDSYWADGGDGRGRNRLGVLLMALRKELRSAAGGVVDGSLRTS